MKKLKTQSQFHNISFTMPKHFFEEHKEDVFRLLTIREHEFFPSKSGLPKYKNMITANDLVNIYLDGKSFGKEYVLVQINGMAFDTLPSLDPVELFRFLLDNYLNIKRIDMAKDDYDNILDLDELIHISNKHNYKNRIVTNLCNDTRVRGILKPNPPEFRMSLGRSLIYGKKTNRITIYEKSEYEGWGADEGLEDDIIRVEISLKKKDQNRKVARSLVDGKPLKDIINQLLMKFLRFVEDGTNRKNNRKILGMWKEFTDNESSKMIFSKCDPVRRKVYGVSDVMNYMDRNNIDRWEVARYLELRLSEAYVKTYTCNNSLTTTSTIN